MQSIAFSQNMASSFLVDAAAALARGRFFAGFELLLAPRRLRVARPLPESPAATTSVERSMGVGAAVAEVAVV